jgi:hypothetical protein
MRKRYAAMVLVAAAVYMVVLALIFVHPFGYPVSIGVAVVLLMALAVLLNRMGKPFRNPEAEKLLTELPDEHLKATDEPHEPARWVP